MRRAPTRSGGSRGALANGNKNFVHACLCDRPNCWVPQRMRVGDAHNGSAHLSSRAGGFSDNAIRGMGLRRRPIAEGGQARGAGTPRNLRPCDRPSQATDRDSDRRRRSPVLLGSPPVPPSSTSYEAQPAPGLRRSLGPPHLANPMWLGRWATRLGWGRCGAEAGEGAEVGSAGLAQGWATGAGFGIWVGAADSRSGQPHAAMSEAL